MSPRRRSPYPATLAVLAVLAGSLTAGDLQAQSKRCAGKIEARLAELPLAPGDAQSVRIVEKVNLDDEFGPEILGVEGWVRLKSCSGWLVVNMRHTCYVLETYTLGDCRVEGLSNY